MVLIQNLTRSNYYGHNLIEHVKQLSINSIKFAVIQILASILAFPESWWRLVRKPKTPDVLSETIMH